MLSSRNQLAAASFFSISRLMVRAFCESSIALCLGKERVEATAMLDRAKRVGGNAEAHRTLQRIGEQRDFARGSAGTSAWSCGSSGSRVAISTALPVSSQRRDMVQSYCQNGVTASKHRVCFADPAPPDTRSPLEGASL